MSAATRKPRTHPTGSTPRSRSADSRVGFLNAVLGSISCNIQMQWGQLAQPAVTLLIAIFLLVWFLVQRNLAARLKLSVLPRWLDHERVVVQLVVENLSRTALSKVTFKLQALPHRLDSCRQLSEWVPFDPFDRDRVPAAEAPTGWKEPADVLDSTLVVLSGESVRVERMLSCPRGHFLHVGFQAKRPRWRRQVYNKILMHAHSAVIRVRGNTPLGRTPNEPLEVKGHPPGLLRWITRPHDSWTTTLIVHPPNPACESPSQNARG